MGVPLASIGTRGSTFSRASPAPSALPGTGYSRDSSPMQDTPLEGDLRGEEEKRGSSGASRLESRATEVMEHILDLAAFCGRTGATKDLEVGARM